MSKKKSTKVIDHHDKDKFGLWAKPPETQWNVLNLGAGVQSSVLALMITKGDLPPVDFAVFADTQAGPDEVYEWLAWLTPQLSFPVYVVTQGDLTEASLRPRFRQKDTTRGPKGSQYTKRVIPLFGIKDGEVALKTAVLSRNCTTDYKITPILRKIKELCGIKRGQKECTVTQWVGISKDEMQRAKYPTDPWSQHYWPLLDEGMTRADCLHWMKENGYPEPPRSACIYCAFHDNAEWLRLKKTLPKEWAKAVKFDKDIRKAHAGEHATLSMEVFLHRTCVPLDEVDFGADDVRPEHGFNEECSGHCGL